VTKSLIGIAEDTLDRQRLRLVNLVDASGNQQTIHLDKFYLSLGFIRLKNGKPYILNNIYKAEYLSDGGSETQFYNIDKKDVLFKFTTSDKEEIKGVANLPLLRHAIENVYGISTPMYEVIISLDFKGLLNMEAGTMTLECQNLKIYDLRVYIDHYENFISLDRSKFELLDVDCLESGEIKPDFSKIIISPKSYGITTVFMKPKRK